jgi:hypothetical protein
MFTRAPAYLGQFRIEEEVCLHIRPEEIIIIPANANGRD